MYLSICFIYKCVTVLQSIHLFVSMSIRCACLKLHLLLLDTYSCSSIELYNFSLHSPCKLLCTVHQFHFALDDQINSEEGKLLLKARLASERITAVAIMKLITIIHLTEAAVVWKLEKTGVVLGCKGENRQPHEVIYRKEKVSEWQK